MKRRVENRREIPYLQTTMYYIVYYIRTLTCSKELNFYLFGNDTNILYTDKILKSLKHTVDAELHKLYVWLTSNKLNLNIKKKKQKKNKKQISLYSVNIKRDFPFNQNKHI